MKIHLTKLPILLLHQMRIIRMKFPHPVSSGLDRQVSTIFNRWVSTEESKQKIRYWKKIKTQQFVYKQHQNKRQTWTSIHIQGLPSIGVKPPVNHLYRAIISRFYSTMYSHYHKIPCVGTFHGPTRRWTIFRKNTSSDNLKCIVRFAAHMRSKRHHRCKTTFNRIQ